MRRSTELARTTTLVGLLVVTACTTGGKSSNADDDVQDDDAQDDESATQDHADSSADMSGGGTGGDTDGRAGSSDAEPEPSQEPDANEGDDDDPMIGGGSNSDDDESGDDDTPTNEPTGPTWHQDVAPVIVSRCGGCHQEGGIGPFSLDTYESASPLASIVADSVESRVMPPWLAQDTPECQPEFEWLDDLRLTDEQIALIKTWAETGAQEGNPEAAADVPPHTSLSLPAPDLELVMPGAIAVEGTQDRFLCFSLDPGFREDTWITASQVTPGNSSIVHHVLTFVDPDGESAALANEDGYYECFGSPGLENRELLGAWAPGGVPLGTPENAAFRVPAGSRLVVNVHYHPTGRGTDVDEGTKLALQYATEDPTHVAKLELIGNFGSANAFGGLLPGVNDPGDEPTFLIPAGVPDHVETMLFNVPTAINYDIRLWALGTHMHYVGSDMQITLQRADTEESECLLETPNWDFNWQRGYVIDAPLSDMPILRAGDTLRLRCTYDNSLANPFVREALDERGLEEPQDVLLGDESLDEMCLGIFGTAVAR